MSNARLLRVIATPQQAEAVLIVAFVPPGGQLLVLQQLARTDVAGIEPGAIAEEIERTCQQQADELQERAAFVVAWVVGERRMIETSLICKPRPPEEQTIYPPDQQGALAQILMHKERDSRQNNLATTAALGMLRDELRASRTFNLQLAELVLKMSTHIAQTATTAPAAAGEADVWMQAKAVALDNFSRAFVEAGAPALPELMRSAAKALAGGPKRLPAAAETPPATEPTPPNGATKKSKPATS